MRSAGSTSGFPIANAFTGFPRVVDWDEVYLMPPSNVYTGFTTTGNHTGIASQFNVQGPWNKGWNFYCDPSKTETVFFPASGDRETNSFPRYVGKAVAHWTAGVQNLTFSAWSMSTASPYVAPLGYYPQSTGYSVRAAQE